MPEPWERLEDERSIPFATFQAYLTMGPADRSILACYRARSGKPQATSVPGAWRKWEARFRWRERAEAYDDYVLAKERRAIETARVAARRRHAALGEFMQRVGAESLKKMDPLTQKVGPVKVDDPDAARALLMDGAKLERLALGDTTEATGLQHSGKLVQEHKGIPPPQNPAAVVLAGLSDGDLETLIGILQKSRPSDPVGSPGGTEPEKPA